MKLKDFLKKVIRKAKYIETKEEKLNTYSISMDLRLNDKAEVSDKGNQIIKINAVLHKNEKI